MSINGSFVNELFESIFLLLTISTFVALTPSLLISTFALVVTIFASWILLSSISFIIFFLASSINLLESNFIH